VGSQKREKSEKRKVGEERVGEGTTKKAKAANGKAQLRCRNH
jgi:hypothetical protein